MTRTSMFALILSACFVSLTWGQQPTCTAYAPWTQFHQNDMRRLNSCESVLSISTVGQLVSKWSRRTGGFLSSSPAQVNGVVYIASYIDSSGYAVNAKSGALVWKFHVFNQAIDGSPAVANGAVYVGSYTGTVYALDAKTGALLWSYKTGSFEVSSATVDNGTVYIGANNNLYALNAQTGALEWRHFTGGGYGVNSPAVSGGVVYVGANNLYALDATTGAVLWSYPNLGGGSSPAVANGVVYVGSDMSMYALDATTGTLLWT